MAATGSLLDFGIVMYLKDNVTREATKVAASLRRIGKDVGLMADTFDNNIGKAITGLGVLTSGLYALNGVAKSLQVAGEFEQISVAINVMAGSVENGTKLLKDLQKVALSTPFDFKDLAKNTKMLMAYGIENRQALKDIQMIGDIAAGVSIERLPFISLGFAQIQAKGRLMGDEAKQLMESGVPIVPAIGKRYFPEMSAGDATKRISELMEQKKIVVTAEEVREIMMSMTQEGGRFYKMMEKQSKTFLGMLSNVREQIYFTNIAIGDALLPTVKELLGITMKYAQGIATFAKTLAGQFFIRVAAGALVLVTALGAAVLGYSALNVSGKLFANILSTQRKQLFLTALANNQYSTSLKILGAEFYGVTRLAARFVAKGLGISFLGYALLNLFKAITGARHGMQALVEITGALYEAARNFKLNKAGIVQSFIGESTGKTLIANNVLDTFQLLAGYMFSLIVIGQSFGRGFFFVMTKIADSVKVVNNAINGLQRLTGESGSDIKSFSLEQFIGRFLGVSAALYVVSSAINQTFLMIRNIGNAFTMAGKVMTSVANRVKSKWQSLLGFFKKFGAFLQRLFNNPKMPLTPNPARQRSLGQTANKLNMRQFRYFRDKDFANAIKQSKIDEANYRRQLKTANLNAQQRNYLQAQVRDAQKKRADIRTIIDVNRTDNDLIRAKNKLKDEDYKRQLKQFRKEKLEKYMAHRRVYRFWESEKQREKARIKAAKRISREYSYARMSRGMLPNRMSFMSRINDRRYGVGSNRFSLVQIGVTLAILAAIVGLVMLVRSIHNTIFGNREVERNARWRAGASDEFISAVGKQELEAVERAKTNAKARQANALALLLTGQFSSLMKSGVRQGIFPNLKEIGAQAVDRQLIGIASDRAAQGGGGLNAFGLPLNPKEYHKQLSTEMNRLRLRYYQSGNFYDSPNTGIIPRSQSSKGDRVTVPTNAKQIDVDRINEKMFERNFRNAIEKGAYDVGEGNTFIIDQKVYLPTGELIGEQKNVIPYKDWRKQ